MRLSLFRFQRLGSLASEEMLPNFASAFHCALSVSAMKQFYQALASMNHCRGNAETLKIQAAILMFMGDISVDQKCLFPAQIHRQRKLYP